MLRTRIFLNLIPFIVILIAVGAYALFLFSQLANTVGATITENYQSDSAAVEMILAVERMDAALDRSRKEEKAPAQLMFDTNARIFEQKLQTQFTNNAVADQMEILYQLRTNFNALKIVCSKMLATNVTRVEQDDLYNNQSITQTDSIKRSLLSIRENIRKNIFITGETIGRVNN